MKPLPGGHDVEDELTIEDELRIVRYDAAPGFLVFTEDGLRRAVVRRTW